MKLEARQYSLGITVVLLAAAFLFITTGLVGLMTNELLAYEFAYLILGCSLALGGMATWGWDFFRAHTLIRARSILPLSVTTLLGFLGFTYLAFWISGEFGSLDNVLLESVSAVTASNFSVIENPETLDQGLLFLRTFTQWIGGFGGFVFFGVLLPIFVRNKEERKRGAPPGLREVLTSSTYSNFLVVLKVYLIASGLIILGYFIAGMSFFDAITYGFSTISTGGFSNHADGLAHFNSSGVEWVASIGMAVAGIRPALLWWGLRGGKTALWRAIEVRVYGTLVVLATTILILARNGGGVPGGMGGLAEEIRGAFFTVTSTISGTGFYLQDWSGFSFGFQVFILCLIATGTMSGTAGGGFGLTRTIESVRYIYRELLVQLHPRVVFKVKLGDEVIGEGSLASMQSFQFIFLGTIMVGAFSLAQLGLDITSAIAGSISALTTMGPSIGEIFSEPGGIAEIPRPAKGVIIGLMILGRFSIFPIALLFFRGVERALSIVKYRVSVFR